MKHKYFSSPLNLTGLTYCQYCIIPLRSRNSSIYLPFYEIRRWYRSALSKLDSLRLTSSDNVETETLWSTYNSTKSPSEKETLWSTYHPIKSSGETEILWFTYNPMKSPCETEFIWLTNHPIKSPMKQKPFDLLTIQWDPRWNRNLW